MRRADRLFQIIQLLRGRRRAVTAKEIAEQLEVSERTIYRDIRDLVASGTPIEGAAGVGYSLRAGYDLPPLMFDEEEIEALVLGARVVAAFGDDRLARAAGALLSKVETVLPKRLRPKLGEPTLFAPRTEMGRALSDRLITIRTAMAEREKIALTYRKEDGTTSERIARPLGAFFWGHAWTMTAWCELRAGFRNFRLDRIDSVRKTGEHFADEPGRTLRDYLRTIGPHAEQILGT